MAEEQAGPAHGTREAAREFIGEMVGGLIAHAQVIRTYAAIGDDTGLLYAGRCTVAYLRAMEAGIAELERTRAVERFRQSGAETGPGGAA